MTPEAPIRAADQAWSPIRADLRSLLTATIRSLHRLLGGDAEALEEMVREAVGTAGGLEEPIAIKVESLGLIELVTLREYVELYVQDWEAGLHEARALLAESPKPLVHKRDEALRHPEFLQLHSATDPDILAAEIGRLEAEAVP